MRRRELVLAVGGSFLTAGCVTGYRADRRTAEAATDDDAVEAPDDEAIEAPDDEAIEAPTLAEQGRPPTICEEEVKPGGIVAIDEPAFGPLEAFPDDPDGYRPMTDDRTVVGLTAGDEARAYPLTILNVHEIVNDAFGDPVLVTYCPICRSGMVADRRLEGEAATFDVSGLLWKPPRVYTAASEADGRVFSDREEGVGNNGNLVMYDGATGSYWSQMLAEGICGPQQGTRLSIRPSTVTTLGEWRAEHPGTEVLLPPPESTLVDPPV